MEVLGSRILLRPTQLPRSLRFYRDTVGLAIYREFGGDDTPGIVFFLGNGCSRSAAGRRTHRGMRSRCGFRSGTFVSSTDGLLDAGVTVLREPRREVWGLEEMWIADPDGVRIVLVEIPEEHPLRRDRRHLAAADQRTGSPADMSIWQRF